MNDTKEMLKPQFMTNISKYNTGGRKTIIKVLKKLNENKNMWDNMLCVIIITNVLIYE